MKDKTITELRLDFEENLSKIEGAGFSIRDYITKLEKENKDLKDKIISLDNELDNLYYERAFND